MASLASAGKRKRTLAEELTELTNPAPATGAGRRLLTWRLRKWRGFWGGARCRMRRACVVAAADVDVEDALAFGAGAGPALVDSSGD